MSELQSYSIVMAKAPQADLDAVRQFLDALQTNVEDDVDEETLGRWVRNAYPEIEGIWERILFGYETLVANACDPTLTYLDWKPEIKQLMTQGSSDPATG